jgi:hypothetical protein
MAETKSETVNAGDHLANLEKQYIERIRTLAELKEKLLTAQDEVIRSVTALSNFKERMMMHTIEELRKNAQPAQ